jgi:hypothetical protein
VATRVAGGPSEKSWTCACRAEPLGGASGKKKDQPVSIRGCSGVVRSEPAAKQVNPEVSTMQFLLLYRTDPQSKPSPAEMQAGYAQWKAWMTKYAKEILAQPAPRTGPKPAGARAVCRAGAVTDGPYVEGKEIVGGWTFVETESLSHAVEIAKEVPMFPSVEIVELTTF